MTFLYFWWEGAPDPSEMTEEHHRESWMSTATALGDSGLDIWLQSFMDPESHLSQKADSLISHNWNPIAASMWTLEPWSMTSSCSWCLMLGQAKLVGLPWRSVCRIVSIHLLPILSLEFLLYHHIFQWLTVATKKGPNQCSINIENNIFYAETLYWYINIKGCVLLETGECSMSSLIFELFYKLSISFI